MWRRDYENGRNGSKSNLLEAPASDGFGEVFGVLVLSEGHLGLDAEDAAIGSQEERFDVATIFLVVDLRDLFPNGAVFDFFGKAFEDYGFVGFFGTDDEMSVSGNVLRFTRAGAGAKPEGILPPDSPDQHEMRTAIGPGCGDPVVVGLLEALESPRPGFEAGGGVGRILQGVEPEGAAWFGNEHIGSSQDERRVGIVAVRRNEKEEM